MNAAPLGVFDSGIGGLTVARALFERLPRESVIYFGDTARVPYGPKSPDTVRRYSGEILAFLLKRGVTAVARELERLDLLANGGGGSHNHRFVVSDDEPHFRKVGALFLGEKLKQVEVVPL